MREHFRRARFAGALAALTVIAGSVPAHAVSPSTVFPGFAGLKDSLGVVPLVADVVVVERVVGDVGKVYVDDCRKLGDALLDHFAAAMTAKGYIVEKRALLSVGATLKHDHIYTQLSTWEQHKLDRAGFPAVRPPLYLDSSQVVRSGDREAWASVVRRTLFYHLMVGMPALFPEATALRDSLGHRYLFVIALQSNRIPQGKAFLHNLSTPAFADMVASTGGSPCESSVDPGELVTSASSTLCRVALIDCRRGEAVWADGACRGHTFSENLIESISSDILKHLP